MTGQQHRCSPPERTAAKSAAPVDFLIIQLLSGLASASSLFLVAAALSIIFGVTRIVNFARAR